MTYKIAIAGATGNVGRRIVLLVLALFLVLTGSPLSVRADDTDLSGKSPEDPVYDKDVFITEWVARASTDALTFGYENYRERLEKSSQYFTSNGWESFVKALQKARAIEVLEGTKGRYEATFHAEPNIVIEGAADDIYRWIIDVPIKKTLFTDDGRKQNIYSTVTLLVVRSKGGHKDGVVIEGWIEYQCDCTEEKKSCEEKVKEDESDL